VPSSSKLLRHGVVLKLMGAPWCRVVARRLGLPEVFADSETQRGRDRALFGAGSLDEALVVVGIDEGRDGDALDCAA
jgi:hypothetical protein